MRLNLTARARATTQAGSTRAAMTTSTPSASTWPGSAVGAAPGAGCPSPEGTGGPVSGEGSPWGGTASGDTIGVAGDFDRGGCPEAGIPAPDGVPANQFHIEFQYRSRKRRSSGGASGSSPDQSV